MQRMLTATICAALLGATARAQDALTCVAGFVAKVTASGVFVAGRELEEVRRIDLRTGAADAFLAMLKVELDKEGRSVTVTAPGGVPVTAVYREGLGCAVLAGADGEVVRAQALAENAPQAPASPLADGRQDEGVERADLDRLLAARLAVGASGSDSHTRALVVLRAGRLVAEGYRPGFGQESLHAGWSMAKTVGGALVMLRADQGKLDIHAPAPIPAWTADGDQRAAITTLHLLRMSSGLQFEESYSKLTSDAVRMLFASQSAAQAASVSPLVHEPGTRFAYSSGTANLLQAVLRSSFAELKAYQTWPRRALFDPAGIRSAVLEADASGLYVGSSFCWMTARDWARFGQLLLDGGVVYTDEARTKAKRVLSAKAVALLHTPAPAARGGQYGAQTWLNRGREGQPESRRFPSLPADLFYASGFQGQFVLVFPTEQVVIVRLGVSTPGASFPVEAFARRVLESL
ncbi:MAG: CubicO group peptidase (beta-lactamase class C family) [Planctomycetota bacterium]|jgi:CubicO group peptidase (beta-lactamase class C family)